MDLDLETFVRDGYVAIRGAVDGRTVAACRELIWAALRQRGIQPDDPGTWPPVAAGLDDLRGEALAAAVYAPPLTAAYDQLIGPGRWERPSGRLGESVVVRLAADERANAGYHIEGSYDAPAGAPGRYWVNVRSRARGLLALILFTDVGRDDAPTRLLCGSHRDVPQFLAPCGEAGTDADQELWWPSTLCRTVAHATGQAGDVFLCHPFIVHTATWPHRGAGPRMIAQPAINAPDGFAVDGFAVDGSDPSPVARAIVEGLALAD
jgi:Phytanoyl-CoA dioxygenase (PhyH)